MTIYIVRHGIAQELHDPGVRGDADRALTQEGREKTREAARGLHALEVRPTRIATSPYRRAEETASILGEALDPQAPVEICDALKPGTPPQDIIAWLQKQADESVMLVGHMPDVEALCSALLTGRSGLQVEFKKAAACCIGFSARPRPGEGCLEWLLQPRHLRALAEPDR